ncbi:MAG TPA: type II toxin-antitoxin system HicA family toxin, partial [Gemmata sp.]|nr:type II toxin-antitoxin system HicA family toxin [Gemmata sp.]
MKIISGKRMCRILERKGWTFLRTKGSHLAYEKPGNPRTVVVPRSRQQGPQGRHATGDHEGR